MRVCLCVFVFAPSGQHLVALGAHESNGMLFQWKTDCSLFRLLNAINCSLCTFVWGSNKDKNLSMHAKPREEQEK